MFTYVISDVHGYFDAFQRLLNSISINFDDQIIIIGDIIDKGPQSIKMLDWCIEHQTANPKCTLLLGDHELMMLNAINVKQDGSFDIIGLDESNKNKRVCTGVCKNCSCDDMGFDLWSRQGGYKTAEEFLLLKHGHQEIIVKYLKKIRNNNFLCIAVRNKQYILSHAGYEPSLLYTEKNDVLEKKRVVDSLRKNNVNGSNLFSRRSYINYGHSIKDTTMIFGHTPVFNIPYHISYELSDRQKVAIQQRSIMYFPNMDAYLIDCGTVGAGVGAFARLSALRLEDLQEFYVTV